MALHSIDNKVVVRWYTHSDRDTRVCYDYRLPNGKGASGSITLGSRKVLNPHATGHEDLWVMRRVTEEDALDKLKANLEESGYEVELEKGHYESVWVPDES